MNNYSTSPKLIDKISKKDNFNTTYQKKSKNQTYVHSKNFKVQKQNYITIASHKKTKRKKTLQPSP